MFFSSWQATSFGDVCHHSQSLIVGCVDGKRLRRLNIFCSWFAENETSPQLKFKVKRTCCRFAVADKQIDGIGLA